MFRVAGFVLLIFAVVDIAHAESAQLFPMDKPLRLGAIRADRTDVEVYERVTVSFDLEASYSNAFDSREIRVDALITPVAGSSWSVPGFFYQAFSRSLLDDAEHLEPGAQEWQVRLSFPAPGRYTVHVLATDKTGTASSEPLSIEVRRADVPGMIRRHPADCRYFATDRGETYFPVGANICWAGRAGTYDYDAWLPKYADAGCNYFRVWLNPSWCTFGLKTSISSYQGIDLRGAWRLDHVLTQAERLGLRIMFCIDSFGELRTDNRKDGQWSLSAYNRANGGPLDRPQDFFISDTMIAMCRDRLRYLVGRYGYSTGLFAWEFWNEVDLTDRYDSASVAEWHRAMAQYLRSIDPWRHLMGTSYSRHGGDPKVDGLPELDFVQTHHYGAKDIPGAFLKDRAKKRAADDRPHFHGEFGITNGTDTAKIDPAGIHIRDGLYSCVGQLQAGAPMSWWWDSYIEPCRLYPLYAGFNRWIAGLDFVAENVRPTDARIVWPSRGGLRIGGRPMPRVFGVQGDTQGLVWLQNPALGWSNLKKAQGSPTVVGATLVLRNVPAGEWKIESWDTMKGEPLACHTVLVDESGEMELALSGMVSDAAFRLHKTSKAVR